MFGNSRDFVLLSGSIPYNSSLFDALFESRRSLATLERVQEGGNKKLAEAAAARALLARVEPPHYRTVKAKAVEEEEEEPEPESWPSAARGSVDASPYAPSGSAAWTPVQPEMALPTVLDVDRLSLEEWWTSGSRERASRTPPFGCLQQQKSRVGD